MKTSLAIAAITLLLVSFASAAEPTPKPSYAVFPLEQLQKAKQDILGEAALKEPGGASYEYFVRAMPPLRYCDAGFGHYPITLSAPSATAKARFVSNGSAINELARQHNWRSETGIPVRFFVDDSRDPFGRDLARLTGPAYAEGYLPVVQLRYVVDETTYTQEAFASTDDRFKENAVVFVRLGAEKAGGRVEAQIENASYELFTFKGGVLAAPDGKVILLGDPSWKWYPGRGTLVADLKAGDAAYLTIFTKPVDAGSASVKADAETYASQRRQTAQTWNELLAKGTNVTVPEPVVMNAWRSAIIGNFMLLHGDEIRYSQGNQYAKLYIGEGGDTTRSIALWGYADDARRTITPLFKYTRKNLEFHQAAFKLQMLAHYFRLTRDRDFLMGEFRPLWEKEVKVILNGREKDSGMLPREKYCGDIDTMVYSLNSNSNCWRGLRDMSIVLAEIGGGGEKERASQLAQTAGEYRKVILANIEKATRRDVSPPFVPVALSGEEEPYDPVWGSIMGSYYNLMIEYILGSGVFTADSQTATDIMHYIQQKGGLCMGMLRARESQGWWVDGGRINDLYGMRYALLLLQRDDPDRALVSFYGKLAQGYTRDTFIGCEGSSIGSPDGWGRQMYLPPNSASHANFLQQLRYILVQDYDLDDDGTEETLRLAFATPRKWLADGQRIEVSKAPTAFGEISLMIASALKDGHVDAEVSLPQRSPPQKVLLRLRLPDGKKITGATADGKKVSVEEDETLDLSGLSGKVKVVATVAR